MPITGPHRLANLLGVLVSFGAKKYSIKADIKANIATYRKFSRFIWVGKDTEFYENTRFIFRPTYCPTCATFIFQTCGKNNTPESPNIDSQKGPRLYG